MNFKKSKKVFARLWLGTFFPAIIGLQIGKTIEHLTRNDLNIYLLIIDITFIIVYGFQFKWYLKIREEEYRREREKLLQELRETLRLSHKKIAALKGNFVDCIYHSENQYLKCAVNPNTPCQNCLEYTKNGQQ